MTDLERYMRQLWRAQLREVSVATIVGAVEGYVGAESALRDGDYRGASLHLTAACAHCALLALTTPIAVWLGPEESL